MDQARYFLAATWYRSVTYTVTRKLERGAVDSTHWEYVDVNSGKRGCSFWQCMVESPVCTHVYADIHYCNWSIIFSLSLRAVIRCDKRYLHFNSGIKYIILKKCHNTQLNLYIENAWENYSLYLCPARSIPLK